MMNLNETLINSNKILKYLIYDILIITILLTIPIYSHWVGFPLYLFDPMRISLFCLIIMTSERNTYLFAFSLPFISSFITGHPIFPKNIIISIELLSNVFIFYGLTKKKLNIIFVIITSIIVSKSLYYLLKYLLINLGLIDMELVSTPFIYQFYNLLFILFLFLIKNIKTLF